MDIDEELASAEKLVLSLRRQHNALIPAVNLPTEILCSFFAYYPVKVERSIRILRPPTWMAILGVCSRWRQTYISTPSLWSDPGKIDIPEMKTYAEVVLKRAMGAPLDIEFHFNDGSSSRLPKALLSATPWLRTLRVTGESYALCKSFRILNETPAPRLEKLHFDLYTEEYDKGHDLRQCRLFADEAPALKTLTLGFCKFAWDWPLLNATTITKLVILGYPNAPRPTLDELLAVLSRLTLLETLSLKDCLPMITHHVEYVSGDRVDLPHLTYFKLVSDLPTALHAVTVHVCVPATATFLLHCVNFSLAGQQEIDPLQCGVLGEAIQSHVLDDGPQPRRPRSRTPREGIRLNQHLIIAGLESNDDPLKSIMEFGTMRYHGQRDLDSPFDFMRGDKTWESSIGLTVSWDEDFEVDVDYMLRKQLVTLTFGLWLNILPSDALQAVFVSGTNFLSDVEFALSFRTMRNVQALTLGTGSQYGALQAMSGLVHMDDTVSNQPLFPSLKRLCLCSLFGQLELSDGSTAFAHLRAMLQRRMDADQDAVGGLRRLERLGLLNSTMPDAQVEELGHLLGHGSVDVVRLEDDVAEEGDP